ncbi:MAG: ComF family protein [Muribaculaceae bacterium]|nr:ComF family protein [Muribaculaceae bacterium]
MKLNKLLRNLYDTGIHPAFNFIFPQSCHLCGTRLPDGSRYVCPSCLSRLPRTLFHRMSMNPMEQRLAGKFRFVNATGHFFYAADTDMAILIHDLKYHHFRGLAEYLGTLVATELFSTSFFSDIDGIIPIPMHWLKKARRGYNQTEHIAKGIGDVLKIPVLSNLTANRPHKTQTRLTAQQRLTNLADSFSVRNPQSLENRHILLLDDVCTTGATLTTASDALLAAAPSLRISLLTLAVTT